MALEELTRLGHVVEQNWSAAWASLGKQPDEPHAQVDATARYLRVYTPGMPEALMNMVMRFNEAGPVGAARIEQVIAPYRAHGLPFQWWLMRGTEPPGLREQLAALGMVSWGGAAAMALPLRGWQPRYPLARGAALGRVQTAQEAQQALGIICEVFSVPAEPMARWTTRNPAFHLYSARWGMHPAAALATLYDQGVVGVYHVATLPTLRRRGIAGNLLMMALREAQAQGCTYATLTATPEARHLYEQLGFRACGVMEQWMPGDRLMAQLTTGGRPAIRWPGDA